MTNEAIRKLRPEFEAIRREGLAWLPAGFPSADDEMLGGLVLALDSLLLYKRSGAEGYGDHVANVASKLAASGMQLEPQGLAALVDAFGATLQGQHDAVSRRFRVWLATGQVQGSQQTSADQLVRQHDYETKDPRYVDGM